MVKALIRGAKPLKLTKDNKTAVNIENLLSEVKTAVIIIDNE